MRTQKATAAELIFAAVLTLADKATEFNEFDITVAAWTLAPDRFGMVGHNHPDHKLVYAGLIKMVGTKKYRPKGGPLIERCGPNTYCLTGRGFREKQRLQEQREAA